MKNINIYSRFHLLFFIRKIYIYCRKASFSNYSVIIITVLCYKVKNEIKKINNNLKTTLIFKDIYIVYFYLKYSKT